MVLAFNIFGGVIMTHSCSIYFKQWTSEVMFLFFAKVLKLGRDYWFLVSASNYNWNQVVCTLLGPNGKLKIIKSDDSVHHQQQLRARCIFKFVEMQPSCKELLLQQKKNNQSARKTVNVLRAKVRFLRVKVKKWNVKLREVPFIFIPATKSSHFPSQDFTPFCNLDPTASFDTELSTLSEISTFWGYEWSLEISRNIKESPEISRNL